MQVTKAEGEEVLRLGRLGPMKHGGLWHFIAGPSQKIELGGGFATRRITGGYSSQTSGAGGLLENGVEIV